VVKPAYTLFLTPSVLSLTSVVFLVKPGYAGPCMRDIDHAWVELGPKMQARIGAGRSAPQSVAAPPPSAAESRLRQASAR
jgi:hypothetical protein